MNKYTLKELREKNKMTLEEVGEKLGGLSRQQISLQESGKKDIKISTAEKYMKLYKMKYEQIKWRY